MNHLLLLIVGMSLTCVSWAQGIRDSHSIRIRVDSLQQQVELKGRSIRINNEPVSDFVFKEKFMVRFQPDGTWSVKSNRRREQLFAAGQLNITGQALELNKKQVPGHVSLSPSSQAVQSRRFNAIIELPLEEYLLDVLASEVPSHWPLETLKAQAVAARSYALVIQKERADKEYHIDSSTQHQVFQYGRHKKVKKTQNIIRAVKQTAAQILVDQDGDIFKTYFHAHCGGVTEDPGAVWGTPDPEFKPLFDKESCESSPSGQWAAEIKEQEFLNYIEKQQGGSSEENEFLSLNLKHKTDSERIETIEIVTLKKVVQLRSQNFREVFGFTRIKSTIFSFIYKDGVFSFKGRGYGHGAGLCQTGSRWMGASGSNFKQILARYYPIARLAKFNAGSTFILSKN